MTFLSPVWFLLLLPVGALIAAYVWMQRRRSRYAVRFTNLDLLDKVAPTGPGWRRHVPPVAFICMLALMVVGFARPTAEVQVPRERATILVAMDLSGSMRATDVQPDRLGAARQAARSFVDGLPERFNVGLVTFAGSATAAMPPVTDRPAVTSAIERLTIGEGGTAIGDAVYTSLQSISTLDAEAGEDPPPAHIVLLSDGANTSGRSPEQSAQEAAAQGVPVSTIAYGTPGGTIEQGGRTVPVPVDGPALRQLAETTGGGFYEAVSGDELHQVYEDIGSSVGYRLERQEVWPWFVGAALIAAALAAAASLVWFSRIP